MKYAVLFLMVISLPILAYSNSSSSSSSTISSSTISSSTISSSSSSSTSSYSSNSTPSSNSASNYSSNSTPNYSSNSASNYSSNSIPNYISSSSSSTSNDRGQDVSSLPNMKNRCSSGSITFKQRCSSGSIVIPIKKNTTKKNTTQRKGSMRFSYVNNSFPTGNNLFLVENKIDEENYTTITAGEIKIILLKRIPSKYSKNIDCRILDNKMIYLCDIEKVKGVIYKGNDKYWEIINIRISKTYTYNRELKLDITISAMYANNTFSKVPDEKSGSYKYMKNSTVDKYREYIQSDIKQYIEKRNYTMGEI